MHRYKSSIPWLFAKIRITTVNKALDESHITSFGTGTFARSHSINQKNIEFVV